MTNLATLWLPSCTNSSITNNTGDIGNTTNSPHFVASSGSNASSNTFSNNLALTAPVVRNWFF